MRQKKRKVSDADYVVHPNRKHTLHIHTRFGFFARRQSAEALGFLTFSQFRSAGYKVPDDDDAVAGAAAAQRWIVGVDGQVALVPFFALGERGDPPLGVAKELVFVNSLGGWAGQEATGIGAIDALLIGDRP